MFDCGYKTQVIGGQREKFVRYGCSLIKVMSYLCLYFILFYCEYSLGAFCLARVVVKGGVKVGM